MANIIDSIIEVPKNTNLKYEFDKKLNMIRLDRILHSSMIYPFNYGYIPNTLADDGDPLDIMVICDFVCHPNIILKSRIIGVLITEDEKGFDEKILAVPDNSVDPSYDNIQNYTDLDKHIINKIEYFFRHYKSNEPNKWIKIHSFENKEKAVEIYNKSLL
tara:strand:+ start:387 stop:866 length:480 start_codon:yes stop_codon:yes gene_type:complete